MFVCFTTMNVMIVSKLTIVMMFISIDNTIIIIVRAKCQFWNHAKVADTVQKPAGRSSHKHRTVC